MRHEKDPKKMHAHKIPMYRNETPHVRWLTTA